MSTGLTFEILTQISQNYLDRRRNSCKECLQNFMYIVQESSERSEKNTQSWWKLTATIPSHIKSYQPGSHVFRRFLGQLSTDFNEIS